MLNLFIFIGIIVAVIFMSRLIKEDPILIQNFAETFDKYIKDNNYTNESFGALIGVSEASVRKYRKGEILPSHTQMRKILGIMKIRYHNVLGFEDPETTIKGQE